MRQSRGLASLSKEERRRIAIMGAKALHAKGLAHQWSSSEARAAGKKGGSRPKPSRRKK